MSFCLTFEGRTARPGAARCPLKGFPAYCNKEKRMNTRLSLAVLGTAVLLAGCAARVDYSTQVLRLEQAISDSAGSIESIDAAVTERQNALLKQRIIDGTLLLDTADEQCGVGRKGCSLVVLEAKEGRASVLSEYPVRSVMPKGREALRMVKRYVGGLKSIVEAETASKVSASANATLGSLEEIADRLAREMGGRAGSGTRFSEYRAPVASLIEWSVEKYVRRVKTEALAKATRDANAVVKALTQFYAAAAQSAKLAEFALDYNTFVQEQAQFDGNPVTAESVDAYVRAAADFDAALRAEAANPFKAFEAAHEKLMQRLNAGEGSVTLVDVATAIERLEEETRTIKALVEGFRKEPEKNGTGGQS